MFALNRDNVTGIDWDSHASVMGFEPELTGTSNLPHRVHRVGELVKRSDAQIDSRVRPNSLISKLMEKKINHLKV